jgi:beta-aspartyl-peptidase (threonine type)
MICAVRILTFFILVSVTYLMLAETPPIKLVIQGGAGVLKRDEFTAEKEKAYRDALKEALQIGDTILRKGGKSLDAVEAVIRFMEDSPLFNAGKGSVLNAEGKVEMDASIMDGNMMTAGAVAAVTTIKNPIVAARKVMEKSEHVMMVGAGAEKFAAELGLEIVDPSYFIIERRRQELIKEQQKKKQEQHGGHGGPPSELQSQKEHGTVGAIALDAHGDLAAGTSTGGRTNKLLGRVGDSAIIGAGTYAKNKVCAVSGTGHGEYFMQTVAAFNICALMEHKGLDAKTAAEQVLDEIKALGGDGGVIVLDGRGRHAMVMNTEGMYRGVIDATGAMEVLIFKSEDAAP